MRKTFAPMDDLLIERVFQPMIDLIVYRMGVGRGAAACFCIDLASLAWIVSRVGGLSAAVSIWDASAAFLDLVILLLGLVALVSLRTVFRRSRGKQGNPLRQAMQPHRAVVLLLLGARLMQLQPMGLANVADIVMLAFATSALYLGACAERPPVRRTSAALLQAG